MASDFEYLHIHQGCVIRVHQQYYIVPVAVVLIDLLAHVRLHLVRDFLVVGFRRPVLLVPCHPHSLVWPAHVTAADFVLDIGTSFPELFVALRSAPLYHKQLAFHDYLLMHMMEVPLRYPYSVNWSAQSSTHPGSAAFQLQSMLHPFLGPAEIQQVFWAT